MISGHAPIALRLRDGEKQWAALLLDQRFAIDSIDNLPLAAATRLVEYNYRFGRRPAAEEPSEKALQDLGAGMVSSVTQPLLLNSTIPAGYTYLGQFIYHDITWLAAQSPESSGPLSHASASLDLDSVLGDDVRVPAKAPSSCPYGPLRIGDTLVSDSSPSLLEDVPRISAGLADMGTGRPDICDQRNDDFLPLGQLHTLFLKFFNKISLNFNFGKPNYDKDAAKTCFIQHIQAVVLYDYLKMIIDDQVYKDIIETGKRKIIRPDGDFKSRPYRIPIEFAAAAGRHGHSMIRSIYGWNRIFDRDVSMRKFILNSYFNGGMQQLDSDWIIDWTRFFPFPSDSSKLLYAKKIDVSLELELGSLDEKIRAPRIPVPAVFERKIGTFNLAQATLKRQFDFGLATIQAIFQCLDDVGGIQIDQLSEEDLLCKNHSQVHAAIKANCELMKKTPIWFYVLREAEICGCGNKLGPLGSRLIMETIHAAIEASPVSILNEKDWHSNLDGQKTSYDMSSLIKYAGDPNPLGK